MDLAKGNVSKTQLTLTKSLRAEYKALIPPAHKMLAERIRARDPGNAPASGDRISFLYIMPSAGQLASKLQGDRIETPSWIKEKGLEIDFKYYMEHQLMNPISQLFALFVHQLPGCVAPGGRNWSQATEGDRESVAIDYLFREALNACDKSSQRRFAQKLFKTDVETRVVTTGRTTRTSAKAAAPMFKQTTLNSLFVQNMILKEMTPSSKKQSKKAQTTTDI